MFVASVSLLAAISPGPDFFIVVRNSLIYSRKAGLWTAVGVCLSLLVHLSYTIVGIGILLAESKVCYAILQYAGVGYLLYLGLSGLWAAFGKNAQLKMDYSKATDTITSLQAVWQGILTNLLNPKCMLFFVSLFSQFITPETPFFLRIEYAAVNLVTTLCWFLFLATLITGKWIAPRIQQFRSTIDGVMGGMLTLLGLKMLFV